LLEVVELSQSEYKGSPGSLSSVSPVRFSIKQTADACFVNQHNSKLAMHHQVCVLPNILEFLSSIFDLTVKDV